MCLRNLWKMLYLKISQSNYLKVMTNLLFALILNELSYIFNMLQILQMKSLKEYLILQLSLVMMTQFLLVNSSQSHHFYATLLQRLGVTVLSKLGQFLHSCAPFHSQF